MAKKKKQEAKPVAELVPVQLSEISIAAPESDVLGEFLHDTENMFKARSMRMKALFGRINETCQHMEWLLRMAAECMDAAEARLEDDFRQQGLMVKPERHEGVEETLNKLNLCLKKP